MEWSIEETKKLTDGIRSIKQAVKLACGDALGRNKQLMDNILKGEQ